MDNGEVIPGLNEDWTFAGAKVMEWISGVAAAFVFGELFITNLSGQMPIFLGVMMGTPLALAELRKSFPDEERGVRNYIMSMMGLCPPDIPRPSALQPYWSGSPLRDLAEDTEFKQLELDNLFRFFEEEEKLGEPGGQTS